MPIDPKNLLSDLKRWVIRFEDDLRQQCKDVPELDARLKAQYDKAKKAKRTAFSYAVWRDGELTQSAVGWVLSCVFVRFLEDNGLLERTYLSGIGEDRELADQTRAAYVKEHPSHSDNDYLAYTFREVARLPGMGDLLDERHNALWNASISPDAAKAFLTFWRRIDPDTGRLAHEFRDPEWDTRFLGDLYQDLSESARKRFALLQTPEFVEEFILDRTLDPAIETFGLKEVRMIDPTCGSGHFLLGGFRRLLRLWEKAGLGLSEREVAVKALAGVYGVDINPFAVAIARFRLLLEAWRYCEVKLLKDAPDFRVNLAVGDSLIHGRRFAGVGDGSSDQFFATGDEAFRDEIAHFFEVEDRSELHSILGQQYHAVVGNPPYITVKDKALNQLYRDRYDTCHRQYSLSVPFMERFFDLAVAGSQGDRRPAGFTGQITANSFMKREFGKKLIEKHISKWDLTHVIDTSGAYIPGHGTPTVILMGRNAKPIATTVRTVLGIKGEPGTPDDPARGKVWSAIVDQVDRPGSESEFVSAEDTERGKFQKHPWSIGGGGAAELQEQIASDCPVLTKQIETICLLVLTRADEFFLSPPSGPERIGIPANLRKEFVTGDRIRDWDADPDTVVIAPYDSENRSIATLDGRLHQSMWPHRTHLWLRSEPNGNHREIGKTWWEWSRFLTHRLKPDLSIAFAFVGTHNHFVLDRGGKVFKQSAPLIKLPAKAKEDDYLRLLGLLNCSAACFWMKQVFHCKGSTVDTRGARQTTVPFEDFYEFDGTKLKQFPVPAKSPLRLARELDRLAREIAAHSPGALVSKDIIDAAALANAEQQSAQIRARMISLQEELDWQCYRHYGLIDAEDNLEWPEDRLEELPPLNLGERTFEIFMARQMARGTIETTWFERHKEAGSRPITEPPAHWPEDYVALYHRRHAAVQKNKNLNLIERPEYKRRWNTEPWAKRHEEALRKWLLTRLEFYFFDADRMVTGEDDEAKASKLKAIHAIRDRFTGGREPRLVSVRQLASAARSDEKWMEAASVYSGRHDFEIEKLVEKLVLAESVPFLPTQRYKPSGLRKRIEWEQTWDLQRQEDAVEERVRKENEGKTEEELKSLIRKAQQQEVGDIPVPPKYGSGDFASTVFWKLRGKLDVPKERWVLYPGAEGGHDESSVIGWAGWDHAQQVEALSVFYQQASETWGWGPDRLATLLAGFKDLLPWLHQWHNELDPEFGDRVSTTYQQFYDTERHNLRMTDEAIEEIRMGNSIT